MISPSYLVLQVCENPKRVNVAGSMKDNSSHFRVRFACLNDDEKTYRISIPKSLELSSPLTNYVDVRPYWSDLGNHTTSVDSKVLMNDGTMKRWYMQGTVSSPDFTSPNVISYTVT